MNQKDISRISLKITGEVSRRNVGVSTESSVELEDAQSTTRSTEDVIERPEDDTIELRDREPMFVLVDSSCVSSPSSTEFLIEEQTKKDQVFRKHFKRHAVPIDMPSTSRDFRNDFAPLKHSDSVDELQMMDINLQSENEIPVDDNNEIDDESIVMSYLKNKDVHIDLEGTLLSTKKKSSLLEDVPRMETILEGEQFSAFSMDASKCDVPQEEPMILNQKVSETSLDAHIPSFPGSPRSMHIGSEILSEESDPSTGTASSKEDIYIKRAVDFLLEDNEFLDAAEIGDDVTLEYLIRKGANVHQLDHLGRNALHLAVVSGNIRAITLLLNAGINPNVKDNVGMTPLSLSLMRSPSVAVANLLFDHGSKILPRLCTMDTGLFNQFVMMCIPTAEEEELLRLLVSKGALVNDPYAPGGRQALHMAAMSNNCAMIAILIELGANMYEQNHRGETPREVAVLFKCKEAAELLDDLEKYGLHSIFSSTSCVFTDSVAISTWQLSNEGLNDAPNSSTSRPKRH